MDLLKEPKEEPLFDNYNETSQSVVGERDIKEEEKSDDEVESHFAMSSFFSPARSEFPHSMAPEPADVKEEEIDSEREIEKELNKRKIEHIDQIPGVSPVEGGIVLRTNGRPSRRASRAVKYNDTLDDYDGDEAPPVKKSRSESDMNHMIEKKRNSSNKGASQSNSDMKEPKVAKLNGTELDCPVCEYRTRSVMAWEQHLRSIHSTNARQAGLALRCECGVDCFTYQHSRTCKIANFTVIQIDDKKETQLVKRNDSELECLECEFRSRSVMGWIRHLKDDHLTTPTLSGLALRCDCGHVGPSDRHSRTCNSTNTTVICKKQETPQCILCEFHPTTILGYYQHFRKQHETTLNEREIYLKCACDFRMTSEKVYAKYHNKKCDGRSFTIHKLNED